MLTTFCDSKYMTLIRLEINKLFVEMYIFYFSICKHHYTYSTTEKLQKLKARTNQYEVDLCSRKYKYLGFIEEFHRVVQKYITDILHCNN